MANRVFGDLIFDGTLQIREIDAPSTDLFLSDAYGSFTLSDLYSGGGGGITATQGSDGYIAFFTGSDSIAGDNDLYWDRENNKHMEKVDLPPSEDI